ncbi:major facilitator superfamily domain-containing protein [Scheffersomyces amazonensis]|uniref:major facilitator superfamily domain-containing protein n=1 Tax=Scheffersomyces amazonensis TaxID=1078765 RepID=UPI00315D78FA
MSSSSEETEEKHIPGVSTTASANRPELTRAVSSESLASSISSTSSLARRNDPKAIPVFDEDDEEEEDVHRRGSSSRHSSFASSPVEGSSRAHIRDRRRSSAFKNRSFSNSSSLGRAALQTLRQSLSLSSSMDSNALGGNLLRQTTTYTVKDIYGEMDEENIRMERTATRATILNELVGRVQSVGYRRIADQDQESQATTPKKTPQKSYPGAPEVEELPGSDESQGFLYEQIPDIAVPTKDFGDEFTAIDPELVTWDGPDDPDYPRNWTKGTKAFQLLIVSLYTLISPMSSSMLSPAMTEIGADLGMHSQFIESFSVSIMVLSWALGPLLIAPISESDRYGRRPVLNISIWIICIFNLACGFAKNTVQLCVFRFLGGLGGCAALNVGAGTLADLFNDSERQMAMAAYSICPTMGPILSPIISSFIITGKSWHWVFYVLAIFNGAVALLGTIFFRETYSPRLLKIKANILRKESGNPHLHTIFEIADGETSWGKFMITVSRPIKLLFTHPMIIGLGSFMAFVYGFMYLMIVTFPRVYRGTYGFSVGISGLMYLPMGIGYVVGTVFWSMMIDRIYHKLTAKNGGVAKPEFRLPCLCFSGIGIPVGLIWYGWSAQYKLHWIMPAIGSAIFAFSFIAVFQTIQNYLIDMNNRFAASSMAAAAVFRSFFGFAFPLFANDMYDTLDYGWGNTLCALIGLALGLPFPIFCLIYGERLRLWANRRMDREQAKRDERNLERLRKLHQQEAGYLETKESV